MIKDFFKSKINRFIFIAQVIALTSFCLSVLHSIFLIITIVSESVFFIVFGIFHFRKNKENNKQKEMLDLLPFSDDEKTKFNKKTKTNRKLNILKGILYIAFGIVLLLMLI